MSSDINLQDALTAACEMKKELRLSQPLELSDLPCQENDHTVLHRATTILRKIISDVAVLDDYPNPSQLSLEASSDLVPAELYRFILRLLDKNAHAAASEDYTPAEDIHRKSLAIAETIIFNSTNMLTPLQFGLAVQLHHDHGSRSIIDTLHAHGLCVNYDELRRFLTSVGKGEVDRIRSGVYIPSGIIPINEGGCMVQEGDDNIDINCETIDGKNTFHSMARVVFQQQPAEYIQRNTIRVLKTKEKALSIPMDAESLMLCEPYRKPRQRPEPMLHDNPMEMMKSCLLEDIGARDMSWIFLRMLPKNVFKLPDNLECPSNQTIPFWTGFNHKLTSTKQSFTAVSFAPVIDSKPADMATVYTTMKRCQEMTASLGQIHPIQTMDQQLYAIAQQVKWQLPEEFQSHVLRLGGFHTVCCFIASVGKLWGDAELRDLLVDADVFAASTVDQMLAGKQFHRAVRGLTLTYEVFMELCITAFISWCETEGKHEAIPDDVWTQLVHTHHIFQTGDQPEMLAAI